MTKLRAASCTCAIVVGAILLSFGVADAAPAYRDQREPRSDALIVPAPTMSARAPRKVSDVPMEDAPRLAHTAVRAGLDRSTTVPLLPPLPTRHVRDDLDGPNARTRSTEVRQFRVDIVEGRLVRPDLGDGPRARLLTAPAGHDHRWDVRLARVRSTLD
jgi:hypothetical protein